MIFLMILCLGICGSVMFWIVFSCFKWFFLVRLMVKVLINNWLFVGISCDCGSFLNMVGFLNFWYLYVSIVIFFFIFKFVSWCGVGMWFISK